MVGRNDVCWCGSGKKWKKCHFPKESPSLAADLAREYKKKYRIHLKNSSEIAGIRQACRLASEILEVVCRAATEGTTTEELNRLAHRLHEEAGATPAPLHYGNPPFPKSICTSLNEVICHGIPNERPLQEGDILNIDVTSILGGYFGDCSKMVCIGSVSEEQKKVVNVSYECLMRAIHILQPGVPISAVGEEITRYAHSQGCSVVHQFVGHGVGVAFHEEPQVPHHRNKNAIPFAPGMIFTIEPMINAGTPEAVIDSRDQWTAYTKDKRPSAQWEHTLLITEEGHEILTTWKKEG